MEWLFFAAALGLILLVLVLLKPNFRSGPSSFPYSLNKSLFTPAERSFLGVIDQALGSRYRIMGKVRIADIVSVETQKDARHRQAAFNRISAKHLDFVLCDKEEFSIVAVIELDDRSHSQTQRRQRDEFVAGVCKAASLTLIRMPARHAYTQSDVQRLVVKVLEPTKQDTQRQAPQPPVNPYTGRAAEPADGSATPPTEKPDCPKCAGNMVRRRFKKGERVGEVFWGCRLYPSCRGTIPYAR